MSCIFPHLLLTNRSRTPFGVGHLDTWVTWELMTSLLPIIFEYSVLFQLWVVNDVTIMCLFSSPDVWCMIATICYVCTSISDWPPSSPSTVGSSSRLDEVTTILIEWITITRLPWPRGSRASFRGKLNHNYLQQVNHDHLQQTHDSILFEYSYAIHFSYYLLMNHEVDHDTLTFTMGWICYCYYALQFHVFFDSISSLLSLSWFEVALCIQLLLII